MRCLPLCLFLACFITSCGSPSGENKSESSDTLPAPEISVEATIPSGEKDEPGALELSLIAAGLVDIQSVLPEVFVDLKYSSTDNFFKKDVYGDLENCYVQPVVADMLRKAHDYLKEQHPELTFQIYDGARPQSVQQVLWDSLDKPDHLKRLYVAHPKKGSLHNYGVALDLTLADAQTGRMLDMGTGYDFFGYPAYPDREAQMMREGKITREQVANREILREAMHAGEFTGIGSEWWHFNAFSRKEAAKIFSMIK